MINTKNFSKYIVILIVIVSFSYADIMNAHKIRKANSYIHKEMFDKASQIYSTIKKSNNKILFNKGYLETKKGNRDDANRYYDLITNSKRSSNKIKAKVLLNQGNDLFQNKEIKESIKYFRKAILLDPSNKTIKYNLELASKTKLSNKKQKKKQKKNKDNKENKNKQKKQNKQSKQEKQKKKNMAKKVLNSFKNDEAKNMMKNLNKNELRNKIEKDW